MFGLEKLEGKLGILAAILLFLVLAGLGLFVWGHHSGSVLTAAEDAKDLTMCKDQNKALASAVATDADTIEGLKAANAQTAQAATTNEADLKKTIATLTAQIAQESEKTGARQQKLKGVVHDDKNAATWAATPVPNSILDILRQ